MPPRVMKSRSQTCARKSLGTTPSAQQQLPAPQVLPPPLVADDSSRASSPSFGEPAQPLLDAEQGTNASPLPPGLPSAGVPAGAPAPAGAPGGLVFGLREKSAWLEYEGFDPNKRVLEDYISMCLDPIYQFVMVNVLGDGAVQKSLRSLVFYFLGGILAYKMFEGWSTEECIYFMMVTSTTVGYGDLSPVTVLGKLFCCFYSVMGITLVLAALAPVMDMLRGPWRENLLGHLGMGFEAAIDTSDETLTIQEVNANINYQRRYMLALVIPAAVLVLGMAIFYFTIRVPAETYFLGLLDVVGIVDSFYWAVVTATTLGYGDLVPESSLARFLVIVYLPVAVIALADAVADTQMISIRRRIRETDYGRIADECLLRDAVRGETNFEPALSESEFMVDQLIANGLVDSDAIMAIRRQFKHLTRRSEVASEEERLLTPKLVYLEIKDRVRKGEQLSGGAEHCDIVWRNPQKKKKYATPSDYQFRWKSFEAWRDGSWQARVLAKEEEMREEEEAHSNGRAGKLKTMIGFRGM